MTSRAHLISSVLYVIEFVLAYVVMLSVMAYNVYVFVAAVLGSALGIQMCTVFSRPTIVHCCLGNSRRPTDQMGEKHLKSDQMKQEEVGEKELLKIEASRP